jgi:hypothetical protein
MSPMGAAHIAAACMAGLSSLVTLYRADEPESATRYARLAAVCAAVSLAFGALSQRAFESTTLRAVFFTSRSAGEWLERHEHLGFAALAFALALGVAPRARAPRTTRALAIAAVAFTLGALCCDAFAHARAPSAARE